MEQIESVVTQLDENKKGVVAVHVIPTGDASAAQVLPVLQDTFGGQNAQNSRSASATQNDALQSRSTTQNQQNNTANRTGTSSMSRGGGVGGGGGSTFP